MALRKPLFFGTTGPEEMAAADSVELGALTMSGDIAMAGNEVTGLPATPSGDNSAVSKSYVDSVAAGLDPKEQVKALDNTGTLDPVTGGLPTNVDGVTSWSAGDRILLTNQSPATENGIWEVQTGAWTRPTDFDTGDPASGAFMFVDQGTNYADTGWVCTTPSGSDVIDTNDLAFSQFSSVPYTAGNGINISGGVISVDLSATNPCLEFDGANDLQFQINGTTLEKTATGARVKGLPSLFEINAVAVGATVTAANLDELTDGSVTTLHSHPDDTDAQRVSQTLTAEENLNQGDPVAVGTVASKYRQCRANDDARVDCIGVVEESGGILADATGTVVRLGIATGVISGATIGARYFVNTTGGLVAGSAGLPGGSNVIFVGTAVTATDLEVKPVYFYKKAA